MIRKVLAVMTSVACLAASAQVVAAQDGFKPGYMDIGPAVGLGGLGDASVSFGGRFEKAIKPLPDLGGGVLGIEVSVDWYSWSNSFFKYSYIPVGATANYHFKMDNAKWDPFLGLGLGYSIVNCTYKGLAGIDVCDNSAVYFIGRAGIRYFYSPKMAFYGDLGAGAATLNVGLMFKMK